VDIKGHGFGEEATTTTSYSTKDFVQERKVRNTSDGVLGRRRPPGKRNGYLLTSRRTKHGAEVVFYCSQFGNRGIFRRSTFIY